MARRKPASPAWRNPGASPVEQYFGPVYHYLYSQYLIPGEQADAEAAFLLGVLKPRTGARWLDVPCGYGRHLTRLAAARPDLRIAGLERQIGFLHAEPGLRARAVNGDMRRMPFAPDVFDAVINLFNSFGYYPRRRGMKRGELTDAHSLAEWARTLKPRGRLVMDLSNRRVLLQAIRQSPLMQYWAGDYEAVEDFEWDAAGQCVVNRTRWIGPEGGEDAGYRLRLYTPAQLTKMLIRAGFEPIQWFGSFDGAPFDPHDSGRMIVVARKNK